MSCDPPLPKASSTAGRLFSLLALSGTSLLFWRRSLSALCVLDCAARLPYAGLLLSDVGLLPRYRAQLLLLGTDKVSLYMISGRPAMVGLLLIACAVIAVVAGKNGAPRWMRVLLWALVLSVQNRNPLLIDGVDDLLRLMLLWSIFLPDRLEKRLYLTPATVGLQLQIACAAWGMGSRIARIPPDLIRQTHYTEVVLWFTVVTACLPFLRFRGEPRLPDGVGDTRKAWLPALVLYLLTLLCAKGPVTRLPYLLRAPSELLGLQQDWSNLLPTAGMHGPSLAYTAPRRGLVYLRLGPQQGRRSALLAARLGIVPRVAASSLDSPLLGAQGRGLELWQIPAGQSEGALLASRPPGENR